MSPLDEDGAYTTSGFQQTFEDYCDMRYLRQAFPIIKPSGVRTRSLQPSHSEIQRLHNLVGKYSRDLDVLYGKIINTENLDWNLEKIIDYLI